MTTSYGIRALPACQVLHHIECLIIESLISDHGIDFTLFMMIVSYYWAFPRQEFSPTNGR